MQHYFEAMQVNGGSSVVEFEGVIYDMSVYFKVERLFRLLQERGYFETRPLENPSRMFSREIKSTHAEMYSIEDFHKNPNCVGTWVLFPFCAESRVISLCKKVTIEGYPVYNNYQFIKRQQPHGIVHYRRYTLDLAKDRELEFFIDLLIVSKEVELRPCPESTKAFYVHILNPRFATLNQVYCMNKVTCAMNLSPFYSKPEEKEILVEYKPNYLK